MIGTTCAASCSYSRSFVLGGSIYTSVSVVLLCSEPHQVNAINSSRCAAVTAYNALMGLKQLKGGDKVLVLGSGGVSM